MKKHLKRHIKQHLTFLGNITQRFVYARRRKKALAVGLFLCINTLLTQAYAVIFVYPNTSIGLMPVTGYTKTGVTRYLDSLLDRTYTMRVRNREYAYTYRDLGIRIDTDAVLREVFRPNSRIFPVNILSLIPTLAVKKTVSIPLVFTQDFYTFISQTEYDFSEGTDQIVTDDTGKPIDFVQNEERYRIDETAFQELLRQRVENNAIPLYPQLVKVTNTKAQFLESVSERIRNIFASSLTVYVDAGGHTRQFILDEKDLADITFVDWSEDKSNAKISVNTPAAMFLINEHIKQIGIMAKGNVATQRVLSDLENALRARFTNHMVDAITIAYDKGPNSNGSLADKYIEVDISQQMMYTFKNNQFVKAYRVSTGLDYPTPTGTFRILNKAGLGFSNIYDSWMPWWMGFEYSNELHAYFGIHEVPYKLTDQNQKLQPASAAFIGKPNTGGCVALGVGDAQEVYRFADIGTKVVIFQ